MARPAADRMRLKDKIIDNISKAIKSIQELLYYQSTNPVLNGGCVTEIRLTLTNSDRQCHKLCENLDHALLHGLKHVTHGYWPVVKQLSHKGLVRDIEILVNVTTDLGRGRAWLFAMLNEGLLECYINLLVQNEKLLRKFYAKDALLLDGDRMTQLQTLTSGLEFVTFKFELVSK
uniref:RUN domain-containing protein n=1 Tax=Biomphalaria glabrata TaxID=6526 RepID=A0A2C9KE44_BIOGL